MPWGYTTAAGTAHVLLLRLGSIFVADWDPAAVRWRLVLGVGQVSLKLKYGICYYLLLFYIYILLIVIIFVFVISIIFNNTSITNSNDDNSNRNMSWNGPRYEPVLTLSRKCIENSWVATMCLVLKVFMHSIKQTSLFIDFVSVWAWTLVYLGWCFESFWDHIAAIFGPSRHLKSL